LDIQRIAVSVLPLLIAITFHEVSHGFVANRLGDPTAKFVGRLTLNPFVHLDLVGTVIMPLLLLISGLPVFGYAKPVPINPMNFKDPKRDMAISAAAGPLTNIILAVISVILFKITLFFGSQMQSFSVGNTIIIPLALMFSESVRINVILAAFNLIPIPPLDGGRVLVGLLPHEQAVSYSKIEPYGFIILFILIFTGIAGYFVIPLANLFMALVTLF
jgi:Zn-dependent protease